MYWEGAAFREREPHIVEVNTGTRDVAIDAKLRTVKAGAKIKQPLSAGEIIELLLASIKGGVTGVQEASTGHYTWTFANTANGTLDPQTVEWYDGQRGFELNGALIDSIKFSGAADGDVMVEVEYWGRDLVLATITGSLTDRVPSFIQGWELAWYLDSFGGTAGSTVKAETLIDWEVEVKNNLTRKYFGDNTTATGDIVVGKVEVNASLTVEANSIAATEYANWDAATKRLMRLKLGNNGSVIGTSSTKPTVTIDVPGAWTAVDLTPNDNGTKVYKMAKRAIYDPTNAYTVKFIVDNDRATAY